MASIGPYSPDVRISNARLRSLHHNRSVFLYPKFIKCLPFLTFFLVPCKLRTKYLVNVLELGASQIWAISPITYFYQPIPAPSCPRLCCFSINKQLIKCPKRLPYFIEERGFFRRIMAIPMMSDFVTNTKVRR